VSANSIKNETAEFITFVTRCFKNMFTWNLSSYPAMPYEITDFDVFLGFQLAQ